MEGTIAGIVENQPEWGDSDSGWKWNWRPWKSTSSEAEWTRTSSTGTINRPESEWWPPININPALHAHDANQTAQQPDDNSHTGNKAPAPPEANPTMQNPPTSIQHSSNDHPAMKPNHDAKSVPTPIRNTRLSPTPAANLSPQLLPQPQTINKRKKLTADDRAALEAQEMVQSGTRRRSKPRQGKWYLSRAEWGIRPLIRAHWLSHFSTKLLQNFYIHST